jgi:hypothetical protein
MNAMNPMNQTGTSRIIKKAKWLGYWTRCGLVLELGLGDNVWLVVAPSPALPATGEGAGHGQARGAMTDG